MENNRKFQNNNEIMSDLFKVEKSIYTLYTKLLKNQSKEYIEYLKIALEVETNVVNKFHFNTKELQQLLDNFNGFELKKLYFSYIETYLIPKKTNLLEGRILGHFYNENRRLTTKSTNSYLEQLEELSKEYELLSPCSSVINYLNEQDELIEKYQNNVDKNFLILLCREIENCGDLKEKEALSEVLYQFSFVDKKVEEQMLFFSFHPKTFLEYNSLIPNDMKKEYENNDNEDLSYKIVQRQMSNILGITDQEIKQSKKIELKLRQLYIEANMHLMSNRRIGILNYEFHENEANFINRQSYEKIIETFQRVKRYKKTSQL